MIRIYVGDILLDGSETIQITYKKADIAELKSRFVTSTNQIKLPITKTNSLVFDLVNFTKAKKPITKMCRIEDEGVTILPSATITLVRVRDKMECQIYETEKDFFDGIKDLTLVDSNFSLTGIRFDATGRDNLRFISSNWNIAAPAMSFGKATSFNKDFLLPVFSYQQILKGIFTLNGYSIDSSLNTILDSTYRLGIPFGKDKLEYSEKIKQYIFATGRNSALQNYTVSAKISLDEIQDSPYGIYDASGQDILIPSAGGGVTTDYLALDVEVRIKITASGVVGNQWRIDLVRNRSSVETVLASSETFTMPAVTLIVDRVFSVKGTPLRAGDEVYPKWVRVSGTPTAQIQPNGCTMSAIVTTTLYLDNIIPRFALPEISCLDVLRDFTVRFGVIYKVIDNVLYGKTIQQILTDRHLAVDWTNKFVKQDEVNMNTSYQKNNYFNYDNQKDVGTNGQGNLLANELESERELFKTIFKTSTDFNLQALLETYDSTSVDVYDIKEEVGNRLLTIRDKFIDEIDLTYNVTARGDYDCAFFTSGQSENTGFQYFLNTFYSALQDSLQNAKIVERYYDLNALDVQKYDPFLLVYDNGEYFWINEIRYNPGKISKVKMLKL